MKNLKMLSILLLLALLSGSIANAVEPNLMKKADKKGMEKWVNAHTGNAAISSNAAKHLI